MEKLDELREELLNKIAEYNKIAEEFDTDSRVGLALAKSGKADYEEYEDGDEYSKMTNSEFVEFKRQDSDYYDSRPLFYRRVEGPGATNWFWFPSMC